MALNLPFKSLLFAVLRLIKDKLQKEVARASGFTVKQLGALERGENKRPLTSPELARILAALGCSRPEVVLATSFLEGIAALDPYADEEQATAIEETIASMARRLRRRLRLPGKTQTSGYPAPYEVELDRAEARESWERLRPLETLAEMSLVVRVAREFQSWAMVELLCEESIRAASKCVKRARMVAQVAVEVAQALRVPEGWQNSLRGYATSHLANAFRVGGNHEAADQAITEAKLLWEAGSDPDQLLDPGRLFDLEASLRRGQRRFDQCFCLLDQAAAITRRPEHVALKRAFTLQVMGDYDQAIEVLVELAPRVENHSEPRLKTIQRFNLCANLTHVQRYREAALLFPIAFVRAGSKAASPLAWATLKRLCGPSRRHVARSPSAAWTTTSCCRSWKRQPSFWSVASSLRSRSLLASWLPSSKARVFIRKRWPPCASSTKR
jgi:transcriptional regulator with XRE-family HTH domain